MTNGLRVNDYAPVGERPSDIIRGRVGSSISGVSSIVGSPISGTPTNGQVIYYDSATDTWLLATIGTLTAAGLNVISPAQLTATTNNWNPTGMATADIVRVSTDASRNLTGIRDPTPISQRLMLENVGAFDLVLVHDGSTSGGGNRFVCPGDVDFVVPKESAVWLNYDVTTGRWRVVEVAGGSQNTQLLPDNDANFTTTIGSWTASAGTLVRDATTALSPLSASMLFTPGASGKHIDLPIAGTFLAGVPYVVVLIVRQGTGADTFRGNFGLIGTDSVQWGDWALITDGGYAISMRWTPTAARTGVSVRWTNLGSGTARVYAARLYQAAEPPLVQIGYRQFLTSAASTVTPWTQFGTNDGGNLLLSAGQAMLQGGPYNGVAVVAHDNGAGADSYLSLWAEHNAADLADNGIHIYTGVDYLSMFVSEKDASTIQLYSDSSGYDIELKDRGAGHFKTVGTKGTFNLNDAGAASRATSIVAAAAIANTETVVASLSMPAGSMDVGTTYRVTAYGRLTSGATAGSSIFRFRIGTTTLTGNIAATLTIANAALVTNAPFVLAILATVRTAGASGTVIGNVSVNGGIVGAFTAIGDVSALSATVAVDTTATKLAEFTYISGNAGTTATFEDASVEIVRA